MKTSRKDVERNKKQVNCPESSYIGYSSTKLRHGDCFLYIENTTTGTFHYRLAKCHGQIKPLANLEKDDPTPQWYILAQSADWTMRYTYERWIDPKDVTEIIPKDRINEHIERFFEDRLKADGLEDI